MVPCHAYPKGSTPCRVEFLMFCLSWQCSLELVRYTFLGLFLPTTKRKLVRGKKPHPAKHVWPLSCWGLSAKPGQVCKEQLPVHIQLQMLAEMALIMCLLCCVIDCWYCRMDCMSVSSVHAVAHHVHLTGGIRINTLGQRCSCRLTGQFSSSKILLRFN